MSIEATNILKKYWGFDSFRGKQAEIIELIQQGKDVLAILPTGGGKSICFQVPTMLREGCCLVITPLIALMQDQVANLQKLDIAAAALYTGMPSADMQQVNNSLLRGTLKFLYISPERLESRHFLEILEDADICLVAVDEAHCISQWGYDFRHSYLRINRVRRLFPKVHLLALTASATIEVQKDIIKRLDFVDYEIVKQGYLRPNLSYAVRKVENKLIKLQEMMYKLEGTGIIYCATRKRTTQVADFLQKLQLSVDYYHAGLSQQERTEKQASWKSGTTRIIVCTNAFGMGIDKPDVRFVIHFDAPDNLESYYQEAGRAGRDGLSAYAVLLLHNHDLLELEKAVDIRFPSFEIIKKVYQNIGDYLQVPVGCGEDLFYDFDLVQFIKNFKLDAQQAVYAIKALEQQGFIKLNESIFLPSKIGFSTTRGIIETFMEMHPAEGRVVNCLLRLYEGIYNYTVPISEARIAQYCHLEEEQIVRVLYYLQAHQLLRYFPKKENPQLYFPIGRAASNYMNFNHKSYQFRKERYEIRLNKMLQYLQNEKDCRSVLIARYFGEKNAKKCGICDHCREQNKKNRKEATAQSKDLKANILSYLQVNKRVLIKDLQHVLAVENEEKWREVISLLLKERIVKITIDGYLYLL